LLFVPLSASRPYYGWADAAGVHFGYTLGSEDSTREGLGLMRCGVFSFFAVAIASTAVARAEPATKVGEAEVIRNDVVSVDRATLSPITVGDAVVRDEVVRTNLRVSERMCKQVSVSLPYRGDSHDCDDDNTRTS
jgi:hypothetical protein